MTKLSSLFLIHLISLSFAADSVNVSIQVNLCPSKLPVPPTKTTSWKIQDRVQFARPLNGRQLLLWAGLNSGRFKPKYAFIFDSVTQSLEHVPRLESWDVENKIAIDVSETSKGNRVILYAQRYHSNYAQTQSKLYGKARIATYPESYFHHWGADQIVAVQNGTVVLSSSNTQQFTFCRTSNHHTDRRNFSPAFGSVNQPKKGIQSTSVEFSHDGRFVIARNPGTKQFFIWDFMKMRAVKIPATRKRRWLVFSNYQADWVGLTHSKKFAPYPFTIIEGNQVILTDELGQSRVVEGVAGENLANNVLRIRGKVFVLKQSEEGLFELISPFDSETLPLIDLTAEEIGDGLQASDNYIVARSQKAFRLYHAPDGNLLMHIKNPAENWVSPSLQIASFHEEGTPVIYRQSNPVGHFARLKVEDSLGSITKLRITQWSEDESAFVGTLKGQLIGGVITANSIRRFFLDPDGHAEHVGAEFYPLNGGIVVRVEKATGRVEIVSDR